MINSVKEYERFVEANERIDAALKLSREYNAVFSGGKVESPVEGTSSDNRTPRPADENVNTLG